MRIRRKLRDYQQRALDYTRLHPNPALFLQMRLGKTLITIRRVRELNAKRVLVVAPNSALQSWEDELAKEYEETVARIPCKRSAKRRLKLLLSAYMLPDTDPTNPRVWILINREAHLALPQIADLEWDVVVLDESTFISNPKSRVSKFFTTNFRSVHHRFVLTGTPNPESDNQLAQQFIFLRHNFLGYSSYWKYRAKACQTDENGWHFEPTPATTQAIRKELQRHAFVLSWRDAGLTVKKIREHRYFYLPPDLRKTYLTAERDFILEHNDKEISRTIWKLTSYVWLRRLAGGFLADPADPTSKASRLVHSAKMGELVSLVKGELAGEKVVVWFCFNDELTTVHNNLLTHGINSAVILGETGIGYREAIVKDFNDLQNPLRILCIQQATMQMGANLSAASTAIYYSEPPGLLARQQTEDRIVDVMNPNGKLFIHFITKNTVDEDIHLANSAKGLRSAATLHADLFARMVRRNSSA